MSMTCLARTPCGVLVLIRTPRRRRSRAGCAVGAQPSTSGADQDGAAEPARQRAEAAGRAYAVAFGPATSNTTSNSSSDAPGGHRIGLLALVRLDGRAARPRLERLVGLPLRDHEVAVLALDRAQQLEAEEARLVVDGVCAVREPLLQFGTGARREPRLR